MPQRGISVSDGTFSPYPIQIRNDPSIRIPLPPPRVCKRTSCLLPMPSLTKGWRRRRVCHLGLVHRHVWCVWYGKRRRSIVCMQRRKVRVQRRLWVNLHKGSNSSRGVQRTGSCACWGFGEGVNGVEREVNGLRHILMSGANHSTSASLVTPWSRCPWSRTTMPWSAVSHAMPPAP